MNHPTDLTHPPPELASTDPTRWEMIARRYQPTVRAYALSLTRDRHHAADLTQDVLLRARRAPIIPTDPQLRAWLWRVTHNLFVDHYRRHHRQPTVPLPPDLDLHLSLRDHEEAFANHLEPTIQAALLQLPYHQRQAVVLRDLYGFSYNHIAHHTNTPAGTVRSRIHRGRATLATLLQPHHATDHPSRPTAPGNGDQP